MINEITYLTKLTDTSVFIEDMINTIDLDYITSKSERTALGVRRLMNDPYMYKDKKVPSVATLNKITEIVQKKAYHKVSNYKKWIWGYGLIMYCGIFENFLYELLQEVLKSNPSLISWSTKSEILSRFREATIKEKFNIFRNKLKISDTEFFDFGIFRSSVQMRYDSVGIAELNEIYKKRNIVAHTDRYIIDNVQQIDYIRDLFEKLIWNLSLKCRAKWNIKSFIVETAKKDN